MFVPPAFAQIVGSQRNPAAEQPQRSPQGRRRLSPRLPGHAVALAALLLTVSAVFLAPSSFATVSASEQSMDFGTQDLGTIGPARGLLVYNEGPGSVLLDSLEFSGPHAGDFEVETENCTEEVLPSGGRCVMGVRFSPGGTGDRAAVLEISSTEKPSEAVDVWLTGLGAGPPPPPVTLTVEKAGDGFGTVSAPGLEIDCGEVCTASVDSGETVTLTATAAEGSVFAGWSGGGCGMAATCETLVEVGTTIYAFFGQVSQPPKATSPLALSKPTVRGRRRVGARLRCGTGQWSGDGPLTFAYTWTRGGRRVSGVHGALYRVRRADRGRKVACEVTASGPGGAASAKSLPVRIRRR